MFPALRGCELLDSGNSPPPHPSILGRAPRNTTPKTHPVLPVLFPRASLRGRWAANSSREVQEEKGEGKEKAKKKKKKGEKLLLSSMHTHTRTLSRGESNSMKPLLCHAAAKNQTGQDLVGRGSRRRGAAASLISSFPVSELPFTSGLSTG